MSANPNPQRKEELARQRAYGETADQETVQDDSDVGYRKTATPGAQPDHGVTRNDDTPPHPDTPLPIDFSEDPVFSEDDTRAPRTNDTYNADQGAEDFSKPHADDPRPNAVTTDDDLRNE